MNAKTNELLRRLEQATSATPVDPSTLDEETAMLRENWLVLGKLLTAAEGEPQQVEVVELRYPASARPRSWRLALACLASAVVVTGLWFVVRTTQSHDARNQARTNQARTNQARTNQAPNNQTLNNHQPDGSTNSRALPSEAPGPANSGATELAWDDDWDNNFAQTAVALQLFHGQRVRDSALLRLEGELQELARDFELGSL